MASGERARLERHLVQKVRDYLGAPERSHSAGPQVQVPEVGEALSRLLQVHLREHEGCSAFPWMDGVLIERIEVPEPAELVVDGWAIEGSSQTCEPFRAYIRLRAGDAVLSTYTLLLGNSRSGPQRIPLKSRWKHMTPPQSWLFVFRGSPTQD